MATADAGAGGVGRPRFYLVLERVFVALLILQSNTVKTVMVGLADLQGLQVVNIPLVAAGMALSIALPLIVFIILHRRLFSGLTVGALKCVRDLSDHSGGRAVGQAAN